MWRSGDKKILILVEDFDTGGFWVRWKRYVPSGRNAYLLFNPDVGNLLWETNEETGRKHCFIIFYYLRVLWSSVGEGWCGGTEILIRIFVPGVTQGNEDAGSVSTSKKRIQLQVPPTQHPRLLKTLHITTYSLRIFYCIYFWQNFHIVYKILWRRLTKKSSFRRFTNLSQAFNSHFLMVLVFTTYNTSLSQPAGWISWNWLELPRILGNSPRKHVHAFAVWYRSIQSASDPQFG